MDAAKQPTGQQSEQHPTIKNYLVQYVNSARVRNLDVPKGDQSLCSGSTNIKI